MTATATAPVAPTTSDVVVVPVARFQDMLARVEPAVARSSWLTALLSIRLFTEPDTLRAQGTDATWGVDSSVVASVQGGFDVLVPAKKLRALVDTFRPAGSVTLELRGTEMVVKSDRSVTRFHTASADEYPTFPQATGTLLDCQGERLKLAADLTAWAAARDDGRPALKNVQAKVSSEGVKFSAADGFAVAVWDGFADDPGVEILGPDREFSVEFLVPASVLRQMGRIAGQQGKNRVTLSVSGEDGSNPNHIVLEASTPEMTLRVTSRCMEGPFPDVQRVIDQSLTRGRDLPTFSQAVFLPDHALTALRRVLLMAADTKNPDGSQPVTGQGIQTTIGDGAVRLEATTQEGEEAHDTFDADTVGHGQVKYGSDLLDKMLVAIKAGDPIGAVTVNVPSPMAPSTFHPEGIPGFVGLISPLDPGKAAEG